MKVLITGGFGFIGGRLGQQFSFSGCEVTLGSRIRRDIPEWLPQAKVVYTDWRSQTSLDDICEGIDVVIHTSGMNAQECQEDPKKAFELNGGATSSIVSASINNKVKRFIYLSTAHVYAAPLIGIFTERSKTTNKHPYATSHLEGENSVLNGDWDETNSYGIYVLRMSNVFGIPTHKHVNCWMLLINDLCKQAITTGKLVLKSSGGQMRNFLPLTDTCNIIENLANYHAKDSVKKIMNIGGFKSFKVIEIASLIQECCVKHINYKPEIVIQEGFSVEPYGPLEYKVNRFVLQQIQFPLEGVRKEIERLLIYCSDIF